MEDEHLVERLKEEGLVKPEDLVHDSSPNLLCKSCGTRSAAPDDGGAKVYRCPKCNRLLVKDTTALLSPGQATGTAKPATDIAEEIRTQIAERTETVGKYILLGKIGEGGYSTVYRAFDPELERVVAIKVFRNAPGFDIQRTFNEARLASKLTHPGIPRVFEIGTTDVTHFIAMEFIEGTSPVPADTAEALRVCREVALVLSYAHSQGIIHRDVKPSNIIVEKSGKVWLSDFGIAKIIDSNAPSTLTRTGQIIGTPQFMSPEQALGKNSDLDHTTDIFSLGATLYYLVTATFPFEGESLLGIIDLIARKDLDAPSKRRPGLPRDIETIIMKAMEKDRAMRFKTAQEFADDIGRVMKGEAPLARPAGFAGKIMRKVTRHKAAFILTIGGILALAFTISYFIGKYIDAKSESASSAQKVSSMIETFLENMGKLHEDALQSRREGASVAVLKRFATRAEEMYKSIRELGIKDARVSYSLGRLYRIAGDEANALTKFADADIAPAYLESASIKFRQYQRVLDRQRFARYQQEFARTLSVIELKDKEVENTEAVALRSEVEKLLQKAPAAPLGEFLAGKLPARPKKVDEEDSAYLAFLIEMNLSNFDEALRIISAAIDFDKGNTAFLQKRAQFHTSAGWKRVKQGIDSDVDWNGAIADLSEILKLNPSDFQSAALLANVHSFVAWRLLETGKEPTDEGIASVNAAIKTFGDEFNLLLHRGLINFYIASWKQRQKKGGEPEFIAAIKDFDHALTLDKTAMQILHYRGMAWYNLASYKVYASLDANYELTKSITDFTNLLSLGPNEAASQCRAGAWRQQLFQIKYGLSTSKLPLQTAYDATRNDLEKLRDPRSLYELGVVHFLADKFELADKSFAKAAELAPELLGNYKEYWDRAKQNLLPRDY